MSRQIRNVTVLRQIGSGGQGTVHLGVDETGQFIAFKKSPAGSDTTALEIEASKAVTLVHPNIVKSFGIAKD